MFRHKTGAGPGALARAAMRPHPEVNGPAALLLFGLAPHGVFPATRITPRAVGSYLTFSPLPALLSKNRRYYFCDTFRRRGLSHGARAFYAACCRMVFGLSSGELAPASDRLPSRQY